MHRLVMLATTVLTACGGSPSPGAGEQLHNVDGGADAEPSLEQQLAAAQQQNRKLLDRAIVKLEQFLAQNPDSPDYSPDAMLRLADLYRHRAALAPGHGGGADFDRSTALYAAILEKFPEYEHRDTALYLYGADLFDAGRVEEAVEPLRALACAGRYSYGPASDTDREAEASGAAADPYAGCAPPGPGSRFVAEAWLLLGDIHFAHQGSETALAHAAAAYSRVLPGADRQLAGLALYKLGWTYYRMDRYADAIERFSALIDLSDREPRSDGPTLRDEAIQYLAICLLEEDWDRDGSTDQTDGLDRLQDPAILDQQAPWLTEICHRLGVACIDSGHEQQAIRVLEHCVARPDLADLPEAAGVQEHLTARELADLVGRLVATARNGR